MKVHLELPYPPSANLIWRRSKFSTYMSKEGKAYKEQVADYIAAENFPKFGDADIKVSMILRPRDKRKRDIDNCLKISIDSLASAGLFDDDFQIQELTIKRGEPISGGLLLVVVELI